MKEYSSEYGTLFHADNMEVLKSLPDNSIDALVTDPPYGLSFMGKKWDYDVPGVEFWKEVLRVLKPGAHGLVACGTRTQHRMAVNLEDAGFEIRDIVMWVYGSGFPKSYNVGKGIEKLIKTGSASWNGTGDDRGGKLGYHKLQHIGGYRPNDYTNAERAVTQITTDEAKQYEGWGTALKPAVELFTLVRKPITEKSIAENVLKWGTGGINIDECRVEGEMWQRSDKGTPLMNTGACYGDWKRIENEMHPSGRFPANLIHDGSDEVVRAFPETSAPGGYPKGTFAKDSNCYGKYNGITRDERFTFDNGGSAARFFYCAKASPSERNEGLEEFEGKPVAWSNQAKAELSRGNIEFSGEAMLHNKILIQKNHHPTVKPIALMEYLVKLITPKGGAVLDPFAGSGTTGIAAVNLKVNYILIEREEDYIPIITARLKHWENKKNHEPGDLFEEAI